MRDLPEIPTARHGVFTSAEALAAGWSPVALKHATRTGDLVRLDRGIYAVPVAGSDSVAHRARFAATSIAAVLVTVPAVASHRSAAALAGLPLWTIPDRAYVTVPPRYTGDARRAHLHRASLAATDTVGGPVARTRAARTVVDTARECGVEQAAVVGDAALSRRMTELDLVWRTAHACRSWPGGRRGLQAAAMLDPRAESPLETVSRLRLLAAGLPPPELQTSIADLAGDEIGRVDLYWDEFGVVGEVDGKDKFRADPLETVWRQHRRQQRLEETGLIVVRWGRPELERMPTLTARLAAAFARGLRRARADRCWVAASVDRFAPRIGA